MKLKLIAAAALFAVAGQASASIANGTSGNGELFLSVYDTSTLTSYTRDLGITMNDFIASGNTTNLSFAANSLLTSNITLSNSTVRWNVAALDVTGYGKDGFRFLSTTNASLATVKTTTNSAATGGMAGVDNYVKAVDASIDNIAVNSSYVNTSANGLAYFDAGFRKDWLGNAKFDSTALVGQSLGFFYITPSSSAGLSKVLATQFAGTAGNAAWTLGANGDLSYKVAAPAAVPVPAAAWLLGSGLLGLVGVARRKAA